MIHTRLTRLITKSAAALTLVSAAQAGTASNAAIGKAPQQVAETKESSAFDKLWSMFTLYKNDSNPVIEEIAFSGRYQG